MSRPNDARSVTSKVLAILDSFTTAQPELTLGQITKRAGLSKPTAHRRVAELVAWGALEQDASGTLRIGVRLWEVAALAPRVLPLRELALPCLEDLLRLTNGNAQLAVRSGDEALFIERLRGRNGLRAHTAAANRLPLTATAVGRALLAFSSPSAIEEILQRPIARFTEYTITDPAEVRAILAQTRIDGYAVSAQQIDVRATSVAAPVFDAVGAVRAAIGVVFVTDQQDVAHLGTIVSTLARALSRVLGADISGRGEPLNSRSASGSRVSAES